MGRWTQYDTDENRLPEGMERIGYDSETRRYKFRDTNGAIYIGTPGEEFGGQLTLIAAPTRQAQDADEPIRLMPNAPIPLPAELAHSPATSSPSSFHDFLPASAIATSPSSPSSRKSGKSDSPVQSPLSRSQTTESGGRPKKSMWNVVRSVTSAVGTVHRRSRRKSVSRGPEQSYGQLDEVPALPSRQPSSAKSAEAVRH